MNLSVKKRDLSVKPDVLRKEGLIPAELYGHGFENLHLIVPVKEFGKCFKEAGESTVVKLDVEGEKDVNVLIHEASKNALTGEYEHIDFYRLRMDEKTKADIPFEFVGEAPAVKEKLGLLVKAMHEIEVEALPADLPHKIEVDLSGLSEVGASIYVSDLKISPNIKLLVDAETVVATITAVHEEEPEPVPESETPAADQIPPAGSENKTE